MIRRLLASLATSLSLAVAACAPGGDLDSFEEAGDTESELALAMTVVPVSKSEAPPGLTILRKKSEFVSFFGQQPPADLDFNKSWVVHYSMGIQNSGGFAAGITAIEREGSGASARLLVRSTDTSPGPNCFVTMALTNPQITVKIPKQKKSIPVDHANESIVTDCGTVQNFCWTVKCAAGFVCDEFQDACVEEPFCPKVKCANGYTCDETVDACVGRLCEPSDAASCPSGMVCQNQIACITAPCPEEFRCEPGPTCADIGYEGTCVDNTLMYCSSNEADDLQSIPCGSSTCGWDSTNGFYDCLSN